MKTCLSCGLERADVEHGRCGLCAVTWGAASAPELVRDILPRVIGSVPPPEVER